MALGENRKDAIPATGGTASAPITNLGPYRIHDRVGSGGMGEVYKAYDDRLERWVAIKRIRPDKEEAAEHRSRLRREARAVARLNHPAIVHVYDIFEDRDSDCIVMELVEGVGLDRLIQHGPMDPYRVAEIGRHIASGLAEAHEKGILHRDLKTENVIIMPNDQPKILDFGLAKPLIQGDLDSTLTGKGQVVGTSRTMSPEYVSGDEVDHRSDLFSLGVLLYESVTAKSPFKAHNTLATLKRVILHRQPPAHDLNPAVPESFSNLIDCLLEKEPAERLQSAKEVVEALSLLTGSSSVGFDRPGSTGSFAVLPRQAHSNRWWMPTLVAVAVTLTLFTAWLVTRDHEGAPPISVELTESSTVVLGEFINRTGEELLDETLDYALRVGLEQSETVDVVSSKQVESSLQRMALDTATPIDRDVGLEIAQREGAFGAIFGQIAKVGGTYTINAEIVEPESGNTVFATNAIAENLSDVIPKLNDIVAALRENLGESAAGVQESRPKLEKVTTSNLEALRAYSRGVDRFNQIDYEGAIPLFEHAIEVDPGFAMAYTKLGTTHQFTGQVELAADYFQSALKVADRLTPEEEMYIRGWVATWTGNPGEMLEAWGTMRDLFPDRTAGHNNYAMTAWLQFRRAEDALEAINDAVASVAGDASRLYSNKAYIELFLERYETALGSFRKTAPEIAVLLGSARTYLAQGSLTVAQKLIEEARGLPRLDEKSRLNVDHHRNLLYLASGRLNEALNLAEAANTWEGIPGLEQSLRTGHLVAAAHLGIPSFQSDFEASSTRAQGLLEISRSELGFSPIPLIALLGKISTRAGYPDPARQLLAEIAPLSANAEFPIWSAYTAILRGELALSGTRFEEARSWFLQSLETLESFQGHESLARLEQVSKNTEASIREYLWVIEHPGRALTECDDFCFDTAPNMLTWTLAHANLALLYAESGDEAKSRSYGESFSKLWKDAPQDQPPLPKIRALMASYDQP